MSDRTPPEPDDPPQRRPIPWHSLADFRIRQAQAEGKFDRIEGLGKPFAWDESPDDENWWVRRKLLDEGISVDHPLLAIRGRIEVVRRELLSLNEETAVRDRLEALNREIAHALTFPEPGPSIAVLPLDVEAEVTEWRRRRTTVSPQTS
jgi:hypothetical protein